MVEQAKQGFLKRDAAALPAFSIGFGCPRLDPAQETKTARSVRVVDIAVRALPALAGLVEAIFSSKTTVWPGSTLLALWVGAEREVT